MHEVICSLDFCIIMVIGVQYIYNKKPYNNVGYSPQQIKDRRIYFCLILFAMCKLNRLWLAFRTTDTAGEIYCNNQSYFSSRFNSRGTNKYFLCLELLERRRCEEMEKTRDWKVRWICLFLSQMVGGVKCCYVRITVGPTDNINPLTISTH